MTGFEFRCTRRDPYDDPGCPGHKNPSARQGYYLRDASAENALARMRKKFPHDRLGFDVQVWKQ